jgi:hypothetical protein
MILWIDGREVELPLVRCSDSDCRIYILDDHPKPYDDGMKFCSRHWEIIRLRAGYDPVKVCAEAKRLREGR